MEEQHVFPHKAFCLNGNPRDVLVGESLGITKRELFAALAMQGLLAGHNHLTRNETAALAVQQADLLLEEIHKRD